MQSIGLLSLLVDLRVGAIAASERDIPAAASLSSRAQIIDGVLALVSGVKETAEVVLSAQSPIDPIVVRGLIPVYCHCE